VIWITPYQFKNLDSRSLETYQFKNLDYRSLETE